MLLDLLRQEGEKQVPADWALVEQEEHLDAADQPYSGFAVEKSVLVA